jgi:hypothetical protein
MAEHVAQMIQVPWANGMHSASAIYFDFINLLLPVEGDRAA